MTGRRRDVRLARIADELAPRDQEIVCEIAARRFVSGTQLRTLFFSDFEHQSTATRRAQATTARLVRLGLLGRLQRRVGGARSGSSGFIFEATAEGRGLAELLSPEGLTSKRQRRSLEPGRSFVAHTLAITQVYVDLVSAERRGEIQLVAEQPEPACWRAFTGPFGTPETLRPDLFTVVEIQGQQQWAFAEIDRGTEGSTALLRKCETYQRYWRSGTEQARHGLFPAVVWLVDRANRIDVLQRVFAQTARPELFRVGRIEDAVHLLSPALGEQNGGA